MRATQRWIRMPGHLCPAHGRTRNFLPFRRAGIAKPGN
jgi:hypothetical protein